MKHSGPLPLLSSFINPSNLFLLKKLTYVTEICFSVTFEKLANRDINLWLSIEPTKIIKERRMQLSEQYMKVIRKIVEE